MFGADVLLQVLLCAPWAGQVMGLWNRKSDLDWIEFGDLYTLLVVFRPELLLLVAACVGGICLAGRKLLDSSFQTLAICVAAQPLALLLLKYAGVNLATSRYATNLLVPLCLLSAYCIVRTPLKVQTFGWIGWAYFSLSFLSGSYHSAGTFTELGRYNWRTAVVALEEERRAAPQAPVFFRSGFVEDDLVLKGEAPPESVWAVLRSPGQTFPAGKLIPLTYNWVVPGRAEYFGRSVEPAVANEPVFFFLTCRCWTGPDSESYGNHFADWVSRHLPNFTVAEVSAGNGMRLLKFEKQGLAGRGAG
jgi:hypothetical protein